MGFWILKFTGFWVLDSSPSQGQFYSYLSTFWLYERMNIPLDSKQVQADYPITWQFKVLFKWSF